VKNAVVDKDHGWKATMEAARALAGNSYVKVGVLSDDERGGLHHKGPDGKAEPLTIAEIAVVQEFGTEDGHVPSRPAHRLAYDRTRAELERMAALLLDRVVFKRDMTVEQALNLMGLKLATAIRNTITQGAGVPPPNAPSTARAKVPKSSTGAKRQKAIEGARPLVDTGAMLNAITWAVFLGTVEKAHRYLTGK